MYHFIETIAKKRIVHTSHRIDNKIALQMKSACNLVISAPRALYRLMSVRYASL